MADVGETRCTVKDEPEIIIIGAGISGLAAADYLSRNGFYNFKILESSSRTGGRIWSINVEGLNGTCKAELGANYIHGIERNPIFQLAEENNLLALLNKNKTLSKRVVFVTEAGEQVPSKTVKEVDWCYGLLMQQCEAFFQCGMQTPIENDSVGGFLDREMERRLAKHDGDDQYIRRLIFKQRLAVEAMISGADNMYEVSLGELGSYEELPGVHYAIPPGFEEVLEVLKRSIPKENFYLNHAVKNIDWQNGVQGSDGTHKSVCVECRNGKKFYADHVICTVPLGYLKSNSRELFHPVLPEEKIEAIQRLEFGTVDKIILEFSEAIPLESDMRKLALLWDNSSIDGQDLSSTWYKHIFSFDAIHENVLLGWISGKAAQYMESLTDDEVIDACMKVLEQFLKKDHIPRPRKIVRTKWHSNEHTKGSYTFIPVGGKVQDIETLAEPLTPPNADKPAVLFAGEACHPSFYSSTHGALLTGQQEAERLVKLYTEHHSDPEPDDDSDDGGLAF
ncbi:unnamed protein product [Owenia fusiformis]|uniref:Uncharacterized protein n=1 Tax=Owenia fusiformis TaxID=6347 RepID=A0A8J1T5Y1_OWEFU|nr:unnamed protein product [Owenia fusiformis]